MKLWWMAALPAAAMWSGWAQEPAQGPDDAGFRLERVGGERAQDETPVLPEEPLASPPVAFDRDAWRRDLSDDNLDAREEAFERLVRRHAGDADAENALRDWAEGGGELAWTARLALRALREEREEPGRGRLRTRALLPDPFGDRGGHGRLTPLEEWMRGADPFGGHDQLRELLDSFGQGSIFGAPGTRTQGQSRGQSRGFQLQVGPNGVRVERSEEVDGELERKVYEAESLEQLLEKHPELRDAIGAVPRDPFGDLSKRVQRLRPLAELSTRTDVLGVMMLEPSAEELRSLSADAGLRVDSTLPGTIAQELGLRRGDVLLELNGRRLLSGSDVREALAERGADQPVELKLIDADGERRTLTWRPD
ncbi:MAG: PDZ domain-containing protein [bacterium]|nr:PDZ domain-containing protein [bacterium]